MSDADSRLEQRWVEIPEFPDYEVSDWGLIFNLRRRTVMSPTRNNHGHMRISLVNDRGRFTRSVARLVAEAFVEPPEPLCDHIVILDGNLTNIAAENLVWRPAGFAWEYARQLKVDQPMHYKNLEVTNVNTGAAYPSIVHAGMAEGLRFADVWRSTYSHALIYPNHHRFKITEGV